MAISDTSPEAARVHLELLRRAGPEGRARLTFSASKLCRTLFESGLRARHPEMSDQQIKREVVRLLYGVVLPE